MGMDGEGGLVGWAGLMKVGVMMVSTVTLVMVVNVGRVGGSGRLKLYDLYSSGGRNGAKKESVAWVQIDGQGLESGGYFWQNLGIELPNEMWGRHLDVT